MTGDLDRLLDGTTPAGVYLLTSATAVGDAIERSAGPEDGPRGDAELTERLAGAGWRVATLPPLDSRHAFYRALADALDLPPWFGGNLDALWDVLADLDRPTALVLTRWTRLAAARPQWWDRCVAVLRERTETGTPFALVLV